MIPDWNINAVLPPVRPGALGHDPDRSPYVANMAEVVERFATTAARITILRGLLRYRAEFGLRNVQNGFQWLNGSFMEQKETLENAAPNDVDVVTFFRLPGGIDEQTFLQNNLDIFDPEAAKAEFRVDAYPYVLGGVLTAWDVRQISYWYSMWSHRRTGVWKGFLQVDLSDDDLALALLNDIELGGVHP